MSDNLDEFRNRTSKIIDVIADAHSAILREVAVETFGKIVELSPVRSGRYRGSNTVAVGSPNTITLPPAPDPSVEYYQPPDLSTVAESIASMPPFSTVWFNNSLPYSQLIEDGHSRQAPSGVYRNSAFFGEERLKAAIAGYRLPSELLD